jgi:release factor glutamine methyltransferase
MQYLGKKVFFADHIFHVAENVYEPAEDSFLFAENLKARKGDKVVDIGTGCGILGIIAATEASEVIAVDTNPHAVHCAMQNAKLNHVAHKMLFIQGDLFSPIRTRKQYDLILFNAPYLPTEKDEENSWIGRAWSGGAVGRDVVDRFISEAPTYLNQRGRLLLMQSTLSNVDETLKKLQQQDLEAEVVAKRDLPFFESIVLVLGRRIC